MKKRYLIIFCVLLTLILNAQEPVVFVKFDPENSYKNRGFHNVDAPDYNIDKDSLAVEGYDLTEYFKKNKASKGLSKYLFKYKGIKYYFLNEKNKSSFIENPEKYLPQFGGYCAFKMGAMIIGSAPPPGKHPANPKFFTIMDNKLYLFSYNGYGIFFRRSKQDKENELKNSNEVWKLILQHN